VDSDADATTGETGQITLGVGQNNTTVDAGLQSIKANLSGVAWDDENRNGQREQEEPRRSGSTVTLYDSVGTVVGTTTTNGSGAYSFTSLEPGNYRVGFSKPLHYDYTAANVGPDGTDSDADPLTGVTALINLPPGGSNTTTDVGYLYIKANLGGDVWNDLNGNGLQDGGTELGIGSVSVRLLDEAGNLVRGETTSAGGSYLFADLEPGNYRVEFVRPLSAIGWTVANVGANDAIDSDAEVATGRTGTITLVAGQTDTTNDGGLITALSGIGDYAWVDLNNNGLQEAGEPAMKNVRVTLYDVNGTAVRSTATSAAGLYQFTDVPPGAYTLGFTTPAAFGLTLRDVGGDDTLDSDADPTTGRTALFTVYAGITDTTRDVGIRHVKPAIQVKALVNGNDANVPPGPNVLTSVAVTLTYVISNAGNAALSDIVLTDSVLGAITCPYVVLAVGEQMTCTVTRLPTLGLNSHSAVVTARTPVDLSAFVRDDDPLFYTGVLTLQ
jgi:hypothetical protein